MVRKFLSILVLAVMVLHCCSRLGLVSYLYKHRYEMAYTLGLTAEKVISMCRGDYFQLAQLTLPAADERQVPEDLPQAQEIVLVFPPSLLQLTVPFAFIDKTVPCFWLPTYVVSRSAVFHPPLMFS